MASTRLSVWTSLCVAASLSALSCAPQHTNSQSLITVISPRSATLATGKKLSFSAVVYGASAAQSSAVSWSVKEVGGGTVDVGGVYTAPATPGTFHVVATSVAAPESSDLATVTVVPDATAIAVSVTPKNASTMTGGTVRFTAAVSGTTAGQSTRVTWSVQEPGGGSVDATGLYTASGSTGTWHVVATSVADPSQSDVAAVQVTATPVITVSVAPKSAATTTGGALTFSATVTGTVSGQSTGVTWSVQETGGGTVDASGHYTAPASAGTFHVIATSVADTTKKDTATVTVTSIAVAISPKTAATTTGGALTFTTTVTGTVAGQSTGVIWSVQETGGGTVDASGHYTAPASAGTFHVVATSVADPTRTDSAAVTVTSIAVAISPKTAATTTGGALTFSATVTGTVSGQSTGVTWSVQETGAGTVDASGHYTAPASTGTFHVVATSVADTTKKDTATVTVTSIAVAISPRTAATTTGGALTFTATVTGTVSGQSTSVTWLVQETGGGTVDTSGHYTAPASAGTFHLIATSVADTTKKDTATVTVTSIAVAISPKTAATTPGGALTFTATVTGTVSGQSTGVTWSVQETGGGTMDTFGHYAAPASAGTFHVIATSVADTTKKDTATVTVTSIAVAISPKTAATTTGGALTFTATVTGTVSGQSTGVTWSVQETGGGTVDTSGHYTAPASAGTFHVIATSVADTTKKDTATVTVTSIAVAISPKTAATTPGGALTFTATVTGTVSGQSTGVTWSVQETGGGTVDTSGHYTAPASAGTFHVIATSVADTTKKDTATVTVTSIAVAISPKTAATITGGALTFTATVTGTVSGQSTGVTWSVQETGGGTVDTSGHYTAPASAGTFHVIATSVADATKNDTATVTVTVPAIAVSVSPAITQTSPAGVIAFTATVTGTIGGQSTAVTWFVQEGPSGGSIDSAGNYTAPSAEGTYHVVATSVADISKSGSATVTVTTLSFIPADRITTWNPGVLGGIPARTTVCATVNASTYGNGSSDAASGIQSAINGCPAGQVVQLSAGTFTINGGGYLLISKGITLRGAGPGQTTLQKTDGAKPGQEATGPNPSPLIIVGPARWANNSHGVTGSTNLTADAVKGAYSVTVASTSGLSAGKVVLLDELSGAIWQADPAGRGQIWASPDWRVVWQRHNPSQGTDDPFPSAASWFSRNDRPTNEVKQIDHISGNTVFFTTPIHISYRASQTAQIAYYEYAHVQNAGVEDLTLIGGDNGNLRFQWSANCWAKRVENTVWHDEGFSIEDSFRVEIRDSYVHDAAWAQPGGAGYAISLASGSAEVLVENSISIKANKVMVARSAGAGSVFGYNYVDDGYINTNTNWIEVGLNASHMVGPHHVLFEGNYGFNWDSDKTHGSAVYHTVFRNHLRGVRRSFNDATHGPRRCAGATYYSYWHTFVGNVLGAAGQMSGWVYQSGDMDTPAIWMFGWDDWSPYPTDTKVAATVLRHGNFDYVTNSVNWDSSISNHTLPPSLYLSQKPAFFNAGSGYVWPWVDPTGAQKLYTLPAKARFDAGTPFVQP